MLNNILTHHWISLCSDSCRQSRTCPRTWPAWWHASIASIRRAYARGFVPR